MHRTICVDVQLPWKRLQELGEDSEGRYRGKILESGDDVRAKDGLVMSRGGVKS